MKTDIKYYMDYVQRDEILNDRFQGNEALFINYIVNTEGRALPDDIKKSINAINYKISGLFSEYCRKKREAPEASEEHFQEAAAKAGLLDKFHRENEYPATDDPQRDENLRALIQKFMDEVYDKL